MNDQAFADISPSSLSVVLNRDSLPAGQQIGSRLKTTLNDEEMNKRTGEGISP